MRTTETWSITTLRSTGSNQPWITRDIAGGGVLSTVFDGDAPNEFPLSKRDAAIIAAAPELLAGLRCAVRWVRKFHADNKNPYQSVIARRHLEEMEAIIAKAEGGGA